MRRSKSSRRRPGRDPFPATAPPARAGSQWSLAQEQVVGRHAGCSVVLDEQYVSQQHAKFFVRGGSAFVEDLGSTNGTWVNTVRIGERSVTPPLRCSITLAQAVPKGKLFDSIIQKATELGVHRIVPLLSERVALQVDPDSATQKTAKWRHVAIESIKQCGSGWLPRVEEPISPARFAARQEPFDLQLVAALQPESCHLRAVLDQYHVREQRPPKSVCIWVGPEGDFTPDEYRLIRQCGARAITLGHLVLRVETASTYSLAVINHELQARHDFVVSRTF
ncbi:MAG: RsmE family RNA methyltransferase [Verrucomicrobiota bacterium]